ncbi:uncharacterized protein LOC111675349 [Lucilia cuprina]|uniref:uncharacterized protein LOC111675349 n=1 Tax=Lucilia cuprina TaxID=7375 RepID=UPI001F068CEB|nr:uncharacterized protein LOC111675349 [Lucilia cuprina]
MKFLFVFNLIFKCIDFYNEKDLKDSETPQLINLTIEDFNAKGQVANPRAPCVVTTIDPEYIKNASLQRRTRKFRMKTDILTLREITRKKFMFYATQQRYLEKQNEAAYQQHTYKRITEYQEFAADVLQKSESKTFNEMKKIQQQLENLQTNKISVELKKQIAEHQRVLMEVQEVYGRFLFLLKLIGYFDEIIAPEDIADDVKDSKRCKLPQPTGIVDLQINERNPIGEKEVASIINFMNHVVRPYLTKRNHLNADIWIKGYERTRQKIFNYNRRFSHLALLNHLVVIVHDKSEKTFSQHTKKSKYLKDPGFLRERIEFLKQRSLEVLDNFERNQKKDFLQIKLNAILPVILEKFEVKLAQNSGKDTKHLPILKTRRRKISPKKSSNKNPSSDSSEFSKNADNTTLEKVEKLQWHLMGILQDLEKIPPEDCTRIENQVRRRIKDQKEMSRRVLVKQNRLHNWMEHFKKHALLQKL